MNYSGAGKSTLFKCLTGVKTNGFQSGHVQILSDRPKFNIATVPQNDALFGQFSVEETLLFASRMKNSDTTPKFGHSEKVADICRAFDLDKVSNVKVADLSGGERKRLAIGVELIGRPDILVLDEPTTGLDACNATLCLKQLQSKALILDIAVLLSIHQPSNEQFCLFDKIYVLDYVGQRIFFGPPSEVMGRFRQNEPCRSRKRKWSLSEFVLNMALETRRRSRSTSLVSLEDRRRRRSSVSLSSNSNGGKPLSAVVEDLETRPPMMSKVFRLSPKTTKSETNPITNRALIGRSLQASMTRSYFFGFLLARISWSQLCTQ